MAEVHTAARSAYYATGGVAEERLADPEELARRKAAWAELIALPDATVLCAETEDGRVVGVLAMGPPYDDDVDAAVFRQLFQIHVEPGTWGNGTGTALHAAFVEQVRDGGFAGGVLEVWAANVRAQEFYAKRGWELDGSRRPGPADVDYLRMRLRLG